MKASILTIGDEILIGQITDTNSGWIARRLNDVGISVENMTTTGDDKEQIIKVLTGLMESSDLIFITGGLGPTNDDITKKVLSEYFDTELVINSEILEDIKKRLSILDIELNKSNYDQSLVPEKAVIFRNDQGTAPGMMFERNGKYIFSMPGVPIEMQSIFDNNIIPFIKDKLFISEITHKTIIVTDISESVLSEKISDWENSLPYGIKLAYLPGYGFIRLRLSAYSSNDEIRNLIDSKVHELHKIIPNKIIAEEDVTPEVLLGNLLKISGKNLSTAESCTGGKIASMITSVPGSSVYFCGSIVSYSNYVKINQLGVNENDIIKFGAVSREVVEQMASGVMDLLGTDYSLSTSGIAGPDGGTLEKPVGTVWIALASKEKVISKKFMFSNNRQVNILRASNMAMLMLAKELISQNKLL